MTRFSCTVNGEAVERDIGPGTLLVDFLRADLGLTGTHVGCDTSQCGACVVEIDGLTAKSCTTLALQAEGSAITTVEGLDGPEDGLHLMQAMFNRHHALQCGFCTSGMLLSGIELVRRNPQGLTREQIRHGLDGNLCRCTGYENIVTAIEAAWVATYRALGAGPKV